MSISLNENLGGARNISLAQIEDACRKYENMSAELEQGIALLESDLERVKQKYLRDLKRDAAQVASAEAELHSLVEGGPDLFKQPRTITMHGVKVGYIYSTGKLEFDDEDAVIALIKRHHKADADIYIRTEEEVNKDALRSLTATELTKLGCRIDGAGDVVVLKRTAGDVEKLINKLMTKLVAAILNEG